MKYFREKEIKIIILSYMINKIKSESQEAAAAANERRKNET